MANYKITYFNLTACAEAPRMMFNYGGIPFEDERIATEDFPTLKPKLPFGQLPLLHNKSNGKTVNQSLAICRYIAKLVNLVGKDDWENLEIDAVVETFNDLRIKISNYHYEPNAEIKEKSGKVLFNETIPYYLERLDKLVATNNGYLALGRLTWADIFLVSFNDYIYSIAKDDIFAKYPNLVALRTKVHAIPSIKKWLEVRPKTIA